MKRGLYSVAAVGWFLLGGVLSTSAADFSRYDLILQRRPFAAATAVDENAQEVVTLEAPPAFLKDLKMCAITESPAGTRVGFVNIKENPPHPYYLYVGDSEDGIVLMDADYDREGALLRKESEQYWLYMRGDGAAPPPAAPQAPRALAPRAAPPVGTSRPSGPGNSGGSSYAARRQQRLEEMRQRAAKARKASEADVEKRLQEYQMDLIRKGLTPLPIPLTEEMDKQLVEEGLLPAVEAME